MSKPKIPKVVEPKIPEKPDVGGAGAGEQMEFRPRGRDSLITTAGLKRKAFTVKSSLLG